MCLHQRSRKRSSHLSPTWVWDLSSMCNRLLRLWTTRHKLTTSRLKTLTTFLVLNPK
jgi:hypothetical protein